MIFSHQIQQLLLYLRPQYFLFSIVSDWTFINRKHFLNYVMFIIKSGEETEIISLEKVVKK